MALVQTELKKIYLGPNVSAMQGPAPTGYHVPSKDENVALVAAMTALGMDTSNGNCMKTYLKMPFAGCRRSSSSIYNQGETGYYWSATAAGAHYARVMLFYSEDFYPQLGDCRSFGYSIRCFKNTPAIPDNNWTTLFDGSSIATGAGIFHNTTSGLISISSDGQNRITIQDKNLGATQVYNDGDTLSEANCGKYYQWGNNYGFAWTGSITTSSTKVDASGYGPGNYYSSSTFITTDITDWSSVQNDNLWGGQYTPIKRVTIRPNGQEKQIRPVGGWTPGANTYGYYTFDDQNSNQITDFSGNNRNLTGGTMPSYTIVSGTNYAGNYTNISSGAAPSVSFATLGGIFTILVWVKPTASSQSYVNCIYGSSGSSNHQISIIWNYNSGQIEYYDAGVGPAKRTAIMSGVSTNTWHLVSYTYNNGAVQTYADGVVGNSITGYTSNYAKTFRLGSSNQGDRFKGQIGECVVENKIRTAQEESDYYNQTKGNYGIQALNNSLNNTFTPTITPDIPDTPGSGTGDILTI